jgi:hypothetical protein
LTGEPRVGVAGTERPDDEDDDDSRRLESSSGARVDVIDEVRLSSEGGVGEARMGMVKWIGRGEKYEVVEVECLCETVCACGNGVPGRAMADIVWL